MITGHGEFDEFLAFSKDCNNVLFTDIKIKRLPSGAFEQLDTGLFTQEGLYNMCWKAPYLSYDGYITIPGAHWNIFNRVTLGFEAQNIPIMYKGGRAVISFSSSLDYKDEIQIFGGTTDCTAGNEVGAVTVKDNSSNELAFSMPDTTSK